MVVESKLCAACAAAVEKSASGWMDWIDWPFFPLRSSAVSTPQKQESGIVILSTCES